MNLIPSCGRVVSMAAVVASTILMPCTSMAVDCQCWRPKSWSCTSCTAQGTQGCSNGWEETSAPGSLVCESKVQKQQCLTYSQGSSGPCFLPPAGWQQLCGSGATCCYVPSEEVPTTQQGLSNFNVPASDSLSTCNDPPPP